MESIRSCSLGLLLCLLLWSSTFPLIECQCAHGDIRLVPIVNVRQGTIDICYEGVWANVVNSRGFGVNEATVACIQLGLISNDSGIRGDYITVATSFRNTDTAFSVSCTGTENSLFNCEVTRTPQHMLAGLGCPQLCYDGEVRLYGGTSERDGRVEVCSSETWRPVCDVGWDGEDAGVLCRHLGYGFAIIRRGSFYGNSTEPFLLTSLACEGGERKLIDCPSTYVSDSEPCLSGLNAGVECLGGCTDGTVRLAGGYTAYDGRVELCTNTVWNQICGLGWDFQEAMTVCRQLGHSVDRTTLLQNTWYGVSDLGQINSVYECLGTEPDLTDCPTSAGTSCHTFGAISVACLPMACPPIAEPPGVISRLVLHPTLSNTSSDYILANEFSCTDNRVITGGDAVNYCPGSGVWTGDPPICGEATCSPLGSLANGRIDYYSENYPSIELGGSAVFICDTGYELTVGSSIRTCSPGSTTPAVWSGEPPLCSIVATVEQLGYINSHQSTYSGFDDEYVGRPIQIPSPLPFGNDLHTTAYVGANGVISFSNPYNFYEPVIFPSTNHKILQSFVVAPFANDLDISINSSVSVGVHSVHNNSVDSVDYQTLDRVSRLVQGRTDFNHPTFRGTWMVFATWRDVKMFPRSALDGSSAYQSLYYSEQQAIDQPNTFQAIVITDFYSTYAIFTYRCGDLNSPGFHRYSAIGVHADSAFSFNHPLSLTPEVTSIACSNPSSEWTNLVYRLNVNSAGVVAPSVDQEKIAQCWEYRLLGPYRESQVPTSSLSAAIDGLPACPCTRQQAMDDKQFTADPLNGECLMTRFPGQLTVGKSCCYRNHSSLPNGLPYVSFFRPHTRLNSVGSILETKFRDTCCEDLSLGVCDLYFSRRSLNPFSSCSSFNDYHPRQRAWSVSGHHLRTFDGTVYTFNGIGVYHLIRSPRFILQGLMDESLNSDRVSNFNAFAMRFNNITVTVYGGGEILEFEVTMIDDREPTERFLSESYYDPLLIEIEFSATEVLVVFNGGPSVGMYLSSNYHSDFEVFANDADLGLIGTGGGESGPIPIGLLGNLNRQTEDDIVAFDGALFSPPVEEIDIYTFAETWGVDSNEALLPTFSFPFLPLFMFGVTPFPESMLELLCHNFTLCVYDQFIYPGGNYIDRIQEYQELDTPNEVFGEWSVGYSSLEQEILLRDGITNCFFINIFNPTSVFTLSEALHNAESSSLINITTVNNEVTVCVSAQQTSDQQTSEHQTSEHQTGSSAGFIPPITLLYSTPGGHEMAITTPALIVCSCQSTGYCDYEEQRGLYLGSSYTRTLPCICDSIPVADNEPELMMIHNTALGMSLPPLDDFHSGPVNLPVGGIQFYGSREHVLFVNSNGMVVFRGGTALFGPSPIPFGKTPLIAPFFDDINISSRGSISYGLITINEPTHLSLAHSYLQSLYSSSDPHSPANMGFFPTVAFNAKWTAVPPYRDYNLPNSNLGNTFSMMLISNSNVTYLVFVYKDIQWSTGASVGFQSDSLSFKLKFSGTKNTLNMHHFSNCGKRGIYVYRVDGKKIIEPVDQIREPYRVYTGPTCADDLDACDHIDCTVGGNCLEAAVPDAGVTCPACPQGYLASEAKCYDVNECADSTQDVCGDGSCVNTFGSFQCFCPSGFTLEAGNQCIDINECLMSQTCNNDTEVCVNTVGSFECPCRGGYVVGTGNLCIREVTVEVFCPADNDPIWWLAFPAAMAGVTREQTCPQNGTTTIVGVATRLCSEAGEWEAVNTTNCRREEFTEVETRAEEELSKDVEDISEEVVNTIITDLVEITDTNTTGGSTNFATDLETTNSIVESTVNYLLESQSLTEFNEEIINVFDNILDDSNLDGWSELQDESEVGSQQLLLNAEMYAMYVVNSLRSEDVSIGDQTGISLVRDNIELTAQEIDPSSLDDILFPEVITTDEELGSAQTRIPAGLLRERGAEVGNVSTVNILFHNLERFLPQDGQLETTRPVTQVLSTQVVSHLTEQKFTTPARFRFVTPKFSDAEIAVNPRCAFWDFSGDIANSKWSTEGVITTSVVYDELRDVFIVECESNHLTAFSVLMDITGVTQNQTEAVQFALSVVSYVGCSISILCLVVTILYILSLRKEVFTKTHNFVHLNLAIVLLLGYVVFLSGISTAVVNRGLCVFVAVLLQYLFTAVFFWMLCEGILLYLMLVVVFSEVAKKWWMFVLIGYIVPIIPVVVSVGIIHEQYGTDMYCWIAVGDGTNGAIWAFVAPSILVIIINIFFLLAALRSVYKQKKSKATKDGGSPQNIALFKDLFMAVIILLPLLGLTWLFGLLSVNNDLAFFVWLFTIFNSLQGVFIFYFHVIRSNKVWTAITSCCRAKEDKTSSVSQRASTSTAQGGGGLPRKRKLTDSSVMTNMSEDLRLYNSFNPMYDEVFETIPDEDEGSTALIGLDEAMFEREDSEPMKLYRPDDDDDEHEHWHRTVTFNWVAPDDGYP